MMFRLYELTRRQTAMFAVAAVVLTIAVAAAVYSCRFNHTYPQELTAIDSLCESRPDSAEILIDKIQPSTLSGDELWYLRLLKVKQNVKANADLSDDKEVKALLEHYESRGDNRLLPLALYCAGCVYVSLNDAPQAIECFQKLVGSACDEKLKSLGCYQLGYLFMQQGLYDDALPWQKKSLQMNVKSRQMKRCIYDYMNLSWTYKALEKPSAALDMLYRARRIAMKMKDRPSLAEVNAQIANICMDQGHYSDAERYLQQSLSCLDGCSAGAIYVTAFRLYSTLENEDSASYYCNKVIKNGSLYGKRNSYFWLTKRFIKQGDLNSALSCVEKYKAYVDTVEVISESEASAKADALYNYNLREAEIFSLRQESLRKNLLVVTSVFFVVFLLLVIILICIVNRNRNKEIRSRIQILKYILDKHVAPEHKTESEDEGDRSVVAQLNELKERMELAERISENKALQSSVDMDTFNASCQIQETEIYSEIMFAARTDTACRFSGWDDLKNTIYSICPNFEMAMLNFKEMNEIEFRVCLLIRIGVPLSKIGGLVCRTTNSVYSVCKRLYAKNFGKNGTPTEWYKIIQSIQ